MNLIIISSFGWVSACETPKGEEIGASKLKCKKPYLHFIIPLKIKSLFTCVNSYLLKYDECN